ncbi:MAG TPA: dipeptide/oligopeptide/nickel ABC transporter permease/ATP-binding protein [Gammaproteobacteria bacterium]|nr:dipeptide/oligopeptide/nickel ABC transporter permease/ATP-binding protein [Gammaproteobacteria bacterium]
MASSASSNAKSPAASSRPTGWQLLSHNRLAAAGLVVLAVIALIAVLAPVLPLPSPDETAPEKRLMRPLADGAFLGTDHLGRDLLSRLIWGTQVSIAVGLSATLVAAFLGSLIGLTAGYAGGRTDNLLMRGIDMIMAFPYILLALAIVAAMGPGLMNALFAIAIVNIPFFARNVRGVSLTVARREFVDAARLSGKGRIRILLTEILPNVLPIIVVTISTTLGWMILETAGLSFLGLGAQPPQADLGSMLGEGRKLLFNAPHVSIIPGLAIFAIVISINLVGDGIRDVLDPRLKSGQLARPAPMTAVTRQALPPDTPPAPEIVLDVRDLKTEFHLGREIYRAVGGVSFSLREEECLGLVGESGCGKSVTAMSLLGLVSTPPGRITGGRVMWGDMDLLDASVEQLRQLRGNKIAYVFQDPLSSLHPLFTVGDQIAEVIRAHRDTSYAQAWSKAIEFLRIVRIPNPGHRVNAYPHELSGGMRQRIGIAMALANDPEVMIADEPTTALDVTVQAQVLKLLDALRAERKTTLLFITHNFGVVSEICDRIAVMYAGRIVEVGSTTEVLNTPAHPYTHKLIDCVPKPGERRRLDTIEGLPPSVNRLPRGCAFADRCPKAEADCRRQEIELTPLTMGRAVRCIHPVDSGR